MTALGRAGGVVNGQGAVTGMGGAGVIDHLLVIQGDGLGRGCSCSAGGRQDFLHVFSSLLEFFSAAL